MKKEVCLWIMSFELEIIVWHTDCEGMWVFEHSADLKENDINYCPKCGRKVEVAE